VQLIYGLFIGFAYSCILPILVFTRIEISSIDSSILVKSNNMIV